MAQQTSFSVNQAAAVAGLLAGASGYTTSRLAATVAIPFGLAVAQMQAADDQCRLPLANKAVITFSADFVASNSIALTVNGTALTATVFATDHATTIAALATKIAAVTNIVSAVADATARTITVIAKDVTLTFVGPTVTGGASQATATITDLTADTLLGVSRFDHQQPATVGGPGRYEQYTEVAIERQTEIWVNVEAAVSRMGQAYVRFKANGGNTQLGAIRGDSDSGTCVAVPGTQFQTQTSGAGLAKLLFNLNPS